MSDPDAAILMIGGYGAVGSEAARALRRLHPAIPLVIAGRDEARASALAAELGQAKGVRCDLDRAGPGLPTGQSYHAVVVFAKDDRFNALDHAVACGAAYVAISDYAVEIAPLVARAGRDASAIPILLLGHHLGALVTMATLDHCRDFHAVDAIRIGAVFDDADLGGATAQADAARLTVAAPHPLVLHEGRWTWAEGPLIARRFAGADSVVHHGTAMSLLDVPSLAAATGSKSVRFDVAVRASSVGKMARHEVIIDIDGRDDGGSAQRRKIALSFDGFHTSASGRAIGIAIEQFLGLDGTPRMQRGLCLPENVLHAAQFVTQARAAGVTIKSI